MTSAATQPLRPQGGRRGSALMTIAAWPSSRYQRSMSYLPCHCGSCGLVVLVLADAAPGPTPCSKCGCKLVIFPGALHAAADLPLFHELGELVHRSISPAAAQALVAEVEEIESEPARTILTRVSVRAPELALPLAALIESELAWRTVTMVLTILRARASVRTRSGFLSATDAETSGAHKR